MDARLAESLGQFDEMLLKEKKVLEQRKRPADSGSSSGSGGSGASAGGGSAGGAGAAGAAGGRSGAEGGQSGAAGQSAAAQGSPSESGEAAAEGSSGADSSQGGAVGGGSGRGPDSEKPSTSTPSDVGDGHDDDVVARQLREAAENERNPELRERLWDEYRAYKSGRRAPARSSTPAEVSEGGEEQKNGGDS